jgi:UDP-3-O-[3-hydroxymyristoyl] glucosamine N-acyltransferase
MGRKLKQPVSAKELAEHLGLELRHGDMTITSVDGVTEAQVGSLCFAKSDLWSGQVKSGCLLLTAPGSATSRYEPTLLSDSPRLDFARALVYLEHRAGFVWDEAPPRIHPTARIGQHVVLGKGVEIDEGSVIYHHVVIGDEVKIGRNCVVKSCAVVGEEGFGFERASSGEAVRLPHIGSVVIGDNVEIGSLTTVCRGTLGDTVIEDGAKIDDHVHIAHNVRVGRHAFVIACAEVSGGVTIGERAWIAPNASVMNQLTIGDDAMVGLGSVVVKHVPAGSVVAGNPAKPLGKK